MAEAKVRDECKGGQLLREIERQQGERTDLTSFQPEMKLTPYQSALKEEESS